MASELLLSSQRKGDKGDLRVWCWHRSGIFYLQLAFFFFLFAAEAPNKRERMK